MLLRHPLYLSPALREKSDKPKQENRNIKRCSPKFNGFLNQTFSRSGELKVLLQLFRAKPAWKNEGMVVTVVKMTGKAKNNIPRETRRCFGYIKLLHSFLPLVYISKDFA